MLARRVGDIRIVDEFPPHLWTGPHDAQDWAADLDKTEQSSGTSGARAKPAAPTRTEVNGDVAYVILPVVIDFKSHEKPMTEKEPDDIRSAHRERGMEDRLMDLDRGRGAGSEVARL